MRRLSIVALLGTVLLAACGGSSKSITGQTGTSTGTGTGTGTTTTVLSLGQRCGLELPARCDRDCDDHSVGGRQHEFAGFPGRSATVLFIPRRRRSLSARHAPARDWQPSSQPASTPASPTVTTSTGTASATYAATGLQRWRCNHRFPPPPTVNRCPPAAPSPWRRRRSVQSPSFPRPPSNITLKRPLGSSGSSATSTVIFKVLDTSGRPSGRGHGKFFAEYHGGRYHHCAGDGHDRCPTVRCKPSSAAGTVATTVASHGNPRPHRPAPRSRLNPTLSRCPPAIPTSHNISLGR